MSKQLMRFEDGAAQFRQRIAVSLLSHRPLLIRNIRADDIDAPGLSRCEASFLRLIDKMTNGSRIEINSTGTQLRLFPGVLIGGRIEHDCPVATENHSDNDGRSFRSIGWFLEGIIPLVPFSKEPFTISFQGITDGTCMLDPSPDYFRSAIWPVLRQFGIHLDDKTEDDIMSPRAPYLKVIRRGAAPSGGGHVEFYCPVVHELRPVDWTVPGKFKRVRGTSISCKLVSTSTAARVAFAAKGLLHRLLPDVWIYTDAHSVKQHNCGPSPSVSIVLSGETTTGVILTAECCVDYSGTAGKRELPEDLGTRGAGEFELYPACQTREVYAKDSALFMILTAVFYSFALPRCVFDGGWDKTAMLLEEFRRGGCVDTNMQSLVLLWMCLTPEDVSRIRLGTLSQYTVESLRLFKDAFGVEFKVKADTETKTVLLSCFGTGYRNMARAST